MAARRRTMMLVELGREAATVFLSVIIAQRLAVSRWMRWLQRRYNKITDLLYPAPTVVA